MAIWALVCAIVTFLIPVLPAIAAFILAAKASRRLRDAPGALAGRGLIIAARITAVVALISNVVVISVLAAGGAWLADRLEGELTVKAAPITLAQGECIQVAGDGALTTVDCTAPHTFEVVGNIDVAADAWPGGEELEARAAADCGGLFRDYVGTAYGDSIFAIRFLTPSQEAWAQDDHVISCALQDIGGRPLTGSMRGTSQ